MNESTPEQIVKLPAHARVLIGRLQAELRTAEGRIENMTKELEGGVGDGDRVFYEEPHAFRLRCALPDHAHIIFRVGVGEVRVTIQKTSAGKELLDINGDSTIMVHPRASNSLQLTHIGRFDG